MLALLSSGSATAEQVGALLAQRPNGAKPYDGADNGHSHRRPPRRVPRSARRRFPYRPAPRRTGSDEAEAEFVPLVAALEAKAPADVVKAVLEAHPAAAMAQQREQLPLDAAIENDASESVLLMLIDSMDLEPSSDVLVVGSLQSLIVRDMAEDAKVRCVQRLLEKRPKLATLPSERQGGSALQVALEHAVPASVVELVLKADPEAATRPISQGDDDGGRERALKGPIPLHLAIYAGAPEAVVMRTIKAHPDAAKHLSDLSWRKPGKTDVNNNSRRDYFYRRRYRRRRQSESYDDKLNALYYPAMLPLQLAIVCGASDAILNALLAAYPFGEWPTLELLRLELAVWFWEDKQLYERTLDDTPAPLQRQASTRAPLHRQASTCPGSLRRQELARAAEEAAIAKLASAPAQEPTSDEASLLELAAAVDASPAVFDAILSHVTVSGFERQTRVSESVPKEVLTNDDAALKNLVHKVVIMSRFARGEKVEAECLRRIAELPEHDAAQNEAAFAACEVDAGGCVSASKLEPGLAKLGLEGELPVVRSILDSKGLADSGSAGLTQDDFVTLVDHMRAHLRNDFPVEVLRALLEYSSGPHCISAAIVQALVTRYPHTACAPVAMPKGKDDTTMLHLLLNCPCSTPRQRNEMEKAALILLNAYPEACKVADNEGNLPLHLAVTSTLDGGHRLLASLDEGKLLDCCVSSMHCSGSLVRRMLDEYPEAAAMKNKEGSLALHLVLCQPSVECVSAPLVQMLLQAHPKAAEEAFKDALPLHLVLGWANPAEDHVKSLYYDDYTYDDDDSDDADMERLAIWSCFCNNRKEEMIRQQLEILRRLLEAYPEAMLTPDRKGKLPLFIALQSGASERVLRQLLDDCPEAIRQRMNKGADGHEVGPLQYALELAVPASTVKLLFDCWPDAVKQKDGLDTLPLQVALQNYAKEEELLLMLLRAYPEAAKHKAPSAPDRDDDQPTALPLHLALVHNAPLAVATKLLEEYKDAAAEKMVIDSYGSMEQPLAYTLENGRGMDGSSESFESFACQLLDAHLEAAAGDDDSVNNWPLVTAIEAHCSEDMVRRLLDAQPTEAFTDPADSRFVLEKALSYRASDSVLALLLQAVGSVQRRDNAFLRLLEKAVLVSEKAVSGVLDLSGESALSIDRREAEFQEKVIKEAWQIALKEGPSELVFVKLMERCSNAPRNVDECKKALAQFISRTVEEATETLEKLTGREAFEQPHSAKGLVQFTPPSHLEAAQPLKNLLTIFGRSDLLPIVWEQVAPLARDLIQRVANQVAESNPAQEVLHSEYERLNKSSLGDYRLQLQRCRRDPTYPEFKHESEKLCKAIEDRVSACHQQPHDIFDKSGCKCNYHTLLQQADQRSARFGLFIEQLAARSNATSTRAPFKSAWRAVEKMVLSKANAEQRSHPVGGGQLELGKLDATNLCDILRGSITCKDFPTLITALQLLRSLDKELGGGLEVPGVTDKIRLVRIKNRFIKPTSGGWADLLINFHFADDEERYALLLSRILSPSQAHSHAFSRLRTILTRVLTPFSGT